MLDTLMILALVLFLISTIMFLDDSVFTAVVIISIIMVIPSVIVLIYSGSISYAMITETVTILIVGILTRYK